VNYYGVSPGTVTWFSRRHKLSGFKITERFSNWRSGIVRRHRYRRGRQPSVLSAVLIPGYDFTPETTRLLRNGSMCQSAKRSTNTGTQQPGYVQQSTAAVLDQSTAAVLDDKNYTAFGHGTMTSGLIHLVAPRAKILPLKAFSSDGTGNLSNIIAALYYAVQQHANVVNMSFDIPLFRLH